MIKLLDLLSVAGVKLDNYKIHCATGVVNPPLDNFFDGKFKEWQEYQRNRNFQCDQIVSLIHLGHLGRDKWLFAGVFKVEGIRGKTKDDKGDVFLYSTAEIAGLEHLIGRAIVRFDKNFRQSYLKGEKYGDQLLVSEIREEKMSVRDFPGYNAVIISYRVLGTIVRQEIPEWKSVLKNVAGIYIITDTKTGKLYVGSACGEGGIWQRWAAYANNGHGGNKDLKALLKSKGALYANHFQFSILEVIDLNANKNDVLARETHWKDVLMSRKFGYNN